MRAAESHHSASRCSTSLRKPVWNLCRGSKVEKTALFRDSGVASSCPTAFWKDCNQKAKHNSAREIWQILFLFFTKDGLPASDCMCVMAQSDSREFRATQFD